MPGTAAAGTLGFFAGCFLKTAVVLTLALLAAVAARRRPAGVRHFILSSALIGLLLIPLLSLAPVGWRSPLLPGWMAAPAASSAGTSDAPAAQIVRVSKNDIEALFRSGARRRLAFFRPGPAPYPRISHSPSSAGAVRARAGGRAGERSEIRRKPAVRRRRSRRHGPLDGRSGRAPHAAGLRAWRRGPVDQGRNSSRRRRVARPRRAFPRAGLVPSRRPPQEPSGGPRAADVGLAEAGRAPSRGVGFLDGGRALLGPLPRALPRQAGGLPGHAARPDEPGPVLVEPAVLGRLP